MKYFFSISAMVIILMAFRLPVSAQSADAHLQVVRNTRVDSLLKMADQFRLRAGEMKQAAIRWATENNRPVRTQRAAGRESELMGFDFRGKPLFCITDNLDAAKTVSTNKVWIGGGMGLNLTGSGDTVREWDGGAVRTTHNELTGRVVQGDGSTSLSDHATHVAGTMVATGVIANARGMAGLARLRAFDWNSDFAEMATEAAMGALVSNHSYGYIAGWDYNGAWYWLGDTTIDRYTDYQYGYYMQAAADVDNIARNAPFYLICKSSGNDRLGGPGTQPVNHYVWGNNNWVPSTTVRNLNGGPNGFDCIGAGFGVSKNVLTVGAVYDIPNGYQVPADVVLASFSGTGPTDDGRIKPDLVANGTGLYSSVASGNSDYASYWGTSMSTPNVTGSLILLQGFYRSLNGTNMRSATLKALAIHTADEAGAAPGPDFTFGWGLLNTATAANLIRIKDSLSLILQPELISGSAYNLGVHVPGGSPLKVTICWTDLPGTPPAASLNPPAKMLVNDLDLRIDGVHQPWVLNGSSPANPATTGDNNSDNVEQIAISNPTTGSHTITITHKGVLQGGDQIFSLIVSGIEVLTRDPLSFSATVAGSAAIDLAWTRNLQLNNVIIAQSVSPTIGVPVNGTAYAAGSSIPGGGTVIYNGPATSFQHGSLASGTTYYYRIWSYNSSNHYSTGLNANAKTYCTGAVFPISENFNASLAFPDCWSAQMSVPGVYSEWSINSSTNAGGTGNEARAHWSYANPGTARLISLPFRTIGLSSLTLSFRHLFDEYGPGMTIRVQSSTDGINWTNEAWFMTSSGDITHPAEQVTTTVVNNLNSPTTRIAFVVTGNLFFFDDWYIDDVVIKAPGLWVGGTPGMPLDWNTGSNWGDGVVPTAGTNVYIPFTSSLPTINNDPASPAECNNLVIESNATLTVNPGKKLIVNGTFTRK